MSRGISAEEDYRNFQSNLAKLLEISYNGDYDETIDNARDWVKRNEPHLMRYSLKDHDVAYVAHTSSAVSLAERIDFVTNRFSRYEEDVPPRPDFPFPGPDFRFDPRRPSRPFGRPPFFMNDVPRPKFITPVYRRDAHKRPDFISGLVTGAVASRNAYSSDVSRFRSGM